MEPRESRETDCFFCSSTLINVPSDHGNIKKYMEYVSVDIDEEWWNTSNFTFCRGCSQRLRTFSERYEKLEKARMEVNSSVQDICGVMLMLQSSLENQEGEGFGHVRKMIVEKSMALLEKARLSRNLPPALDGPFPVSSSEGETRPHPQDSMASGGGGGRRHWKQKVQGQRSKKAMTSFRGSGSEDVLSGKKKASGSVLRQRRTRRSPMPLPDFIVKIGRTEIKGKTQPLYHCGICSKDFPSCQLANHRRHGIPKEIAETSTRKNLDLEDESSPSQEKEVEPMVVEIEDEEDSEEEDDDDMAKYAKNLDALYACGNPAAFSSTSTSTSAAASMADSTAVIQAGPTGGIITKLNGKKPTASSSPTSREEDVTVSLPSAGSILSFQKTFETMKEKESPPKLRKKFARGGKVTRRSISVVAAELPDFISLRGRIIMYNRIHKLYYCSICEKDVKGTQLYRHKRKHGIGLDVCEVCGESFKYRHNFVKHVARKSCGGGGGGSAS